MGTGERKAERKGKGKGKNGKRWFSKRFWTSQLARSKRKRGSIENSGNEVQNETPFFSFSSQ